MAVTTNALIPALEDVRQAHAAVLDRFRSDVNVTPVGPHRSALEDHMAATQEHIARIDDRLRVLRPRRPLQDTIQSVGLLARDAVRLTRLPWEIGALIAAEAMRGRQSAGERRLLRNAEDEYAITARAVAACRAGQSIAEGARDRAAADLFEALLRQDEELLRRLQDSLAEHAAAVAAEADGGRRPAAEGGPDEEAARAADETPGAVTRAEDLPVSGYEQLGVSDITGQLRMLSQADLTVIEGYERAHAHRPEILNTIERLRGSQPWPVYDDMTTEQIKARLHSADPVVAGQVLEYERDHRRRTAVITAAEARIAL
ncbi:hypothetical protein [Streptomyces aurantiogriseus]|uniref:Uncharacterized protein n=1 Tax=Streptomyces aurantiogriseus TaxID=66870 RepID=A0A918EZX2_9ACTN|nr:hypothetical protein [Streptomyces aurantiogriseus]GGQ95204.1 hypothetical protein GCM10010251_07060 [Streptomyces aurantiogriseus]